MNLVFELVRKKNVYQADERLQEEEAGKKPSSAEYVPLQVTHGKLLNQCRESITEVERVESLRNFRIWIRFNEVEMVSEMESKRRKL